MDAKRVSFGLGLFSMALGLAVRQASRHRALWGALAFVAGATVIDALVARTLDRNRGRALPVRSPSKLRRTAMYRSPPRRHAAKPATTIEPEHMPLISTPDVTHH